MKAFAISLAAGAVLWAAASTPAASAMPTAELAGAASELALDQGVRWVCSRHRCRWRPDYYRPRVYYGYTPGLYGVYGPAWYGGYGPGLGEALFHRGGSDRLVASSAGGGQAPVIPPLTA